MYENITFNDIINRMLDAIPEGKDKRKGSSIIYNYLAPIAVEMVQLYQALDTILAETFADSASRIHLIKRCAERGITPYPATCAEIEGIFTPSTIDVMGARFMTVDGLRFVVTARVEPGIYRLTCESEGAPGNVTEGLLVPLAYIAGLETAEIRELIIPGEDDEDTEHLRQRYFDSLFSQAYGGNIADYRLKTNGLSGVGGTKVFRAWQGGGTVKLVVIDSRYLAPSDAHVLEIQAEVDPERVPDMGGVGFAPIGHVVTVFGAREVDVQIAAEIQYELGYDYESMRDQINNALDSYYEELRRDWEHSDRTTVRISQIEARLLNLIGIVDVHGTTLNGIAGNLTLEPDEIPVRGGGDAG